MGRGTHDSAPCVVVAAPCPQGEQDCVKAWPLVWELTKQHCSSLWDWKLPVGRGQPDTAGTAWAAWGDRLT